MSQTSERHEGIDISHWNGEVDLKAVCESGRDFAYMKATGGLAYRDSMFGKNWAAAGLASRLVNTIEAERIWLARGAYHYAEVMFSAEFQAMHFARVVGPLGVADLHPVLDLEEDQGKSKDYIAEWTAEFIAAAAIEFKRPVVVYSDADFLAEHATPVFLQAIQGCPLWVARYASSPPVLPAGFAPWKIWQYTCSRKGPFGERVPGAGQPDKDVLLGSLRDLQGYPAAA